MSFTHFKRTQILFLLQASLVLTAGLGFSGEIHAQAACREVFAGRTQRRAAILIRNERPSLTSMLLQLELDGKLFYTSSTPYQAGTDFLASNEYDWLKTPFDDKPADVLVAFGTNSSWEIAVNKRVKKLYLADWSPYPLLASAYVMTPLMRVAQTPQEFLTLLSGRLPTPDTNKMDLNLLMSRLVDAPNKQAPIDLENMLTSLAARTDISDFELKFLASYFRDVVGNKSSSSGGVGPFQELRNAVKARLLLFLDHRYRPARVAFYNKEASPAKMDHYSAFANQQNFLFLRNLFVENRIQYGLGAVTDSMMYYKIKNLNQRNGYQDVALSITNIFDCGCYNGLTFSDMQNYLANMTRIFEATPEHPIPVFRTLNTRDPHSFLRYDLESSADAARLAN